MITDDLITMQWWYWWDKSLHSGVCQYDDIQWSYDNDNDDHDNDNKW